MLLELLETPSDDFSTSVLMSFRSALSSLESSVHVGEETDTGVRSEVDLSGKRSHSVIKPVLIEGSKFVSCIRDGVLVEVLT